jgi:hypothetical protein
VPLVTWQGWRHRPGAKALARLIARQGFASANIGILTGLSGITIVDCDDAALTPYLLDRLGATPLAPEPPSGGSRRWCRASGEPSSNLRRFGLAVDIRGVGGFAVVPPSRRPSGEHAGKLYRSIHGGWDDVLRLPQIRPGGLEELTSGRQNPAVVPASIAEGNRNGALFREALARAPLMACLDELAAALIALNTGQCQPALREAEICRIAASAWRY